MAITRGKLADIQYIASTAGSVYANPAATKSFLKGVTLFNVAGSSQTVKLFNVPDSGGSLGTAADANQCFEVVLATKESFAFDWPGDGLVLTDTNDSLQASSTNASSVTITLHGLKDA
jgi:hypothetical protein